MNHFQRDLMISSRVVDSKKVFRVAIQFKPFFLTVWQNGELRIYCYRFYPVYLWYESWCSGIQSPRFTTSAKNINLSLMVSLWQVIMLTFNLHLEEWSMDSNIVSNIWLGMSTTSIHLLKFKISNITFAILLFFSQKYLHLEYFGVYFSWWNHQMLQNGSF